MTPQAAAAPVDGAGGAKDMPGTALPSLLAGAVDLPFSLALSELQVPPQATDSKGSEPGREDPADPLAVPTPPTDPSAAALAAVLQWLQQSAPVAAPPQKIQGATTAPGDSAPLSAAAPAATAAAASMPALLPTQLKEGAAAGAATRTDDDLEQQSGGTGASAGARDAGKANAAVASSKPLAPELRGLANLLSLGAPDAETVRPDAGEAADAKPDLFATAGNAPSTGTDAANAAPVSAAPGGERIASLRAGVDTAVAPPDRVVSVPVHDRRWSQAIAAQVLILADHRIEGATLRLTPEHLGPVEVRIDFQDSQVNVNFGAAHSDTRTALEQALPRLREVLAGAGLTLGEASVQQQMRRGPQNRGDGQRTAAVMADRQPVAAIGSLHALRMVDEYA